MLACPAHFDSMIGVTAWLQQQQQEADDELKEAETQLAEAEARHTEALTCREQLLADQQVVSTWLDQAERQLDEMERSGEDRLYNTLGKAIDTGRDLLRSLGIEREVVALIWRTQGRAEAAAKVVEAVRAKVQYCRKLVAMFTTMEELQTNIAVAKKAADAHGQPAAMTATTHGMSEVRPLDVADICSLYFRAFVGDHMSI